MHRNTGANQKSRLSSALKKAINACIDALTAGERDIEPDDLEVAELSIQNGRRAFRRIAASEIQELIN